MAVGDLDLGGPCVIQEVGFGVGMDGALTNGYELQGGKERGEDSRLKGRAVM